MTKKNFWMLLTPLLAALMVLAGFGPVDMTSAAEAIQTESSKGEQTKQQTDGVMIPDFSPIVSEIRPSVVTIDVATTAFDIFDRPQEQQGAGTGWVYDESGYIVTNNHVVEGADNITITLNDGRVFSAEDIFTDSLSDLAVVKITAENLTAASTGNTSVLEVGDWVCAIGNSLGLGISATVGVISAVDVSFQNAGELLTGWIQTDAAINPGNSGGPLVNTSGEVIGINSIKIQQTGIEGMGYAISIVEALPIIQTLITQGSVVRPYMGINVMTITPSLATRYNLSSDSGVLIMSVTQGGPASLAGLRSGDIIITVEDREVSNIGQLLRAVNSYQVGDIVTVTYLRGSTENAVEVTLDRPPSSPG